MTGPPMGGGPLCVALRMRLGWHCFNLLVLVGWALTVLYLSSSKVASCHRTLACTRLLMQIDAKNSVGQSRSNSTLCSKGLVGTVDAGTMTQTSRNVSGLQG